MADVRIATAVEASVPCGVRVPLIAAYKSLSTLNLYRYHPGKPTAAELADASDVADRVSDDIAASGMFGDGTGQAFRWLTTTLPLARTRVWQAVNEVTVELDVLPADALALLALRS